ncbi:MAG: hypothetical protein RBU29_14125 [bacterium]|jgi:hypothetical protein|nr:hypothetical protein [bacterium]
MIRLLKAFLHDSLSWALMLLLLLTIGGSFISLYNRYERVDRYKLRLSHMEHDIRALNEELLKKQDWAGRLQNDLTALEQVARDKMNYLGPDEILVTFYPAPAKD